MMSGIGRGPAARQAPGYVFMICSIETTRAGGGLRPEISAMGGKAAVGRNALRFSALRSLSSGAQLD
jgi:hypothetical protein